MPLLVLLVLKWGLRVWDGKHYGLLVLLVLKRLAILLCGKVKLLVLLVLSFACFEVHNIVRGGGQSLSFACFEVLPRPAARGVILLVLLVLKTSLRLVYCSLSPLSFACFEGLTSAGRPLRRLLVLLVLKTVLGNRAS